jgi:hypothetical protein
MHIYAHTGIHAHYGICIYAHVRIMGRVYICTYLFHLAQGARAMHHTYGDICALWDAYICVYTRIYLISSGTRWHCALHAHTCIHTYAYTYRTHTHTHTHTHARTDTQTHKHTHTHTHTQYRVSIQHSVMDLILVRFLHLSTYFFVTENICLTNML